MTGSKTATVETLTAEVRVLMVGSRQVTLSVYGQLDFTAPQIIEPFGRVRPKDAEEGYLYLVGRNPAGELVKARAPVGTEEIMRAVLEPAEYAAWRHMGVCLDLISKQELCGRCSATGSDGDSKCEKCLDRGYGAERAWWEAPRPGIFRYPGCGCGCWTRGPLTEDIGALEDKALPLFDRAAELSHLPLIVLAGLR
jgi:hypothetical protein